MVWDNPREIREAIRRGELSRPTCGIAPGYAQANLVILPSKFAFDFFLFCQRNPKPCPILEVLEPGEYEPTLTTPGADIRVDVPKYRIYENGELVSEEEDITRYWSGDMVSFLLGCSFTFEAALMKAGIPLRHISEGKNVAMYVTNIQTIPAGIFSGPTVVTMRPIPTKKVIKAVQITSRCILSHGAPVHIGDPGRIGITDLAHPDYGDAVEIENDEVLVFWACGVTPQAVAQKSKIPLIVTHSPGHMFITDLLDEDLAVI